MTNLLARFCRSWRSLAIVAAITLFGSACGSRLPSSPTPKVGETYRVGFNVKQTLHQQVNDTERVERTEIQADGVWRVESTSKNRSTDLVLTFDSLTLRKAMPDAVIEYSMRTPPGDSPQMPMGYTRSFAESPISIRLDGHGRLERVEGADALLNKLHSEPDLADRQDPDACERELRVVLSDRGLADTLHAVFDVLPPRPAKLGAEWEAQHEILLERLPVSVKTHLKLRSMQSGTAQIEANGEYISTEGGILLDSMALRITGRDIKGQGHGVTTVSVQSGMSTRTEFSSESHGEVAIAGLPNLDPSVYWPFRIERVFSFHAVPDGSSPPAKKSAPPASSKPSGSLPDFSAPIPNDN